LGIRQVFGKERHEQHSAVYCTHEVRTPYLDLQLFKDLFSFQVAYLYRFQLIAQNRVDYYGHLLAAVVVLEEEDASSDLKDVVAPLRGKSAGLKPDAVVFHQLFPPHPFLPQFPKGLYLHS